MSDDDVRQQEFAERMLRGMTASAEILSIELGRRLGLYHALEGGMPTNAEHLALRTGIAERYAREWLEQQAAAGILDVVTPYDDSSTVTGGDEKVRRRRRHGDSGRQHDGTRHPRTHRHPARTSDATVAERGSHAADPAVAADARDPEDAADPRDPEDAADQREYALPAALEPMLIDPEHPAFLMGIPPLVYSLAATLPEVEHAYRTGAGVGYARFGPELRYGIAALNRPGFAHDLRGWVETLPDLASRLDTGGTVLDAGCGSGWSTIALARAFPTATVIGVDLDEDSVTDARTNAVASGIDAERVRFETVDAAGYEPGSVDLVTVFEALHDMAEPVRVLSSFARALAPGGAVLVADEKVEDEFTAPASDDERLQYAFSVLHCLPATMAEKVEAERMLAGEGAVANGTVLRTPTVRRWARAAGFRSVEILPVEHQFWRFYRID